MGNGFSVSIQFLVVLFAECVPSDWIMGKPLAERRGWSYVLQPLVPGSFFLGNAAGPEPVHQDAVSVPGFLGVINSFDGYVHTKRFDKGIEPGKFFSVELRRDMRFTGPPTEAVCDWGKKKQTILFRRGCRFRRKIAESA